MRMRILQEEWRAEKPVHMGHPLSTEDRRRAQIFAGFGPSEGIGSLSLPLKNRLVRAVWPAGPARAQETQESSSPFASPKRFEGKDWSARTGGKKCCSQEPPR